MKKILMPVLILGATASFAAEIQVSAKKVLCEKIVTDVFMLDSSKTSALKKNCKKNIKTTITNKLTHRISGKDLLTGVDSNFYVSVRYKGETLKAKGTSRVLREYTTNSSGAMVKSWKVLDSQFILKSSTIGLNGINKSYLEALDDQDIAELLKNGDIKSVSGKMFNSTFNEFDIFDLFEGYMEPYDMPDMEIRNHEEIYYIYVKGGVKLPFAILSSWEAASTEWDELDFDEDSAIWFADGDVVLSSNN